MFGRLSLSLARLVLPSAPVSAAATTSFTSSSSSSTGFLTRLFSTAVVRPTTLVQTSISLPISPSILATAKPTTMLLPSQMVQIFARTVKVRTAVKKRCEDCYFVKRRGIVFVQCKKHPRHKQRQG